MTLLFYSRAYISPPCFIPEPWPPHFMNVSLPPRNYATGQGLEARCTLGIRRFPFDDSHSPLGGHRVGGNGFAWAAGPNVYRYAVRFDRPIVAQRMPSRDTDGIYVCTAMPIHWAETTLHAVSVLLSFCVRKSRAKYACYTWLLLLFFFSTTHNFF